MKNKTEFYQELLHKFTQLAKEHNLLGENITVSGKTLSDEEALGNPERRDYPLLTGKESLMEACFHNGRGQAFTDQPGPFEGSLSHIIDHALESNHSRAVFIAALNAVTSHLKLSDKTIHCRNEEPEACAGELSRCLEEKHGKVKIALVGYQPAMLEKLKDSFPIRVLDLDADKIGTIRYGIEVEHGIEKREEVLQWSDIILCTGSTIANGTLPDYLGEKPVYFFGTTIAGTAELMGLNRLCFKAAS
ncbi:MAG: DUF364 domain-containing protein [Spirochaetales bacterium]|nr:DUF364 domain-containing protein [Spirochaetales bacterium]